MTSLKSEFFHKSGKTEFGTPRIPLGIRSIRSKDDAKELLEKLKNLYDYFYYQRLEHRHVKDHSYDYVGLKRNTNEVIVEVYLELSDRMKYAINESINRERYRTIDNLSFYAASTIIYDSRDEINNYIKQGREELGFPEMKNRYLVDEKKIKTVEDAIRLPRKLCINGSKNSFNFLVIDDGIHIDACIERCRDGYLLYHNGDVVNKYKSESGEFLSLAALIYECKQFINEAIEKATCEYESYVDKIDIEKRR